jgi:oligopeptidase B
MKVKYTFQIVLLFSILFGSFIACKEHQKMKPPLAKKIKKIITVNGHSRIDNYFWLNERNNQQVIDYLNAENTYTEAMMSDYKALEKKLYNEIISRIKQTDESVPIKENGYYYYTRYEEKKEYPIYCRKKANLDTKEEIILNVNELAQGHSFCKVSGINISKDNKTLAYGVDTVSRRLYVVHFKNLETGELFDITIPHTTGTVAWCNDNKTLFYTVKDEQTLRAYKIYKHILGTPLSSDQLIFTEKDETFGSVAIKTKSYQYILIVSFSKTSDEVRFLNADNPAGNFKIIQPRKKNLEYNIDHFKDKFYIVTNFNAKNFRLMETPVNKTGIENWKEIIPHRSDVFLENIEIFSDYFVVTERKDGLIHLKITDWASKLSYYVDFGEEVYTASIGINPDFDSEDLRYNYSSLTTPSSIYDYNMNTRKKVLKKRQEVIGTFRPEDYTAKRLNIVARDGKKVPVSLVYKNGITPNGKNPLLLTGYGAYGISTEPSFSSVRLSLLDRGFIYAIAHIRGGQEMGREWYEEGKMLNKLNTFYDFIDCAEFLVKQKYTAPEKMFCMGGSAGGLLIGTVINMRPDLFKGAIAAVPFVDIVTTMLDESIPLTTSEYSEWGNPHDSVYYNYMMSYSPYDNLKPMKYPALMVMAGFYDSQVQYWEPAKWVAKMRTIKTDDNQLLLWTNMKSGHGGASGRFEMYKDNALEYTFLLKLLDIKN